MYKVFFNDSTLIIGTENNKSILDSNFTLLNSDDDRIIDQVVCRMELSSMPLAFALVVEDPDRFWFSFRNRFTVIQAAGGLVRNKDACWLFIKRLGYWDLPKGKIEMNELPSSAAMREVEEECGLRGLIIRKELEPTFHLYRSPYIKHQNNLVLKETHWFLMEYHGSEDLVPQVEEHIEAVRWIPGYEMESVLEGTYLSLQDLIRKNYQ
jgi:8-oxo-dGTP pyrophosphatase MutT (NUDIX family)